MRNKVSQLAVGAYITLGDAMRQLMETGEFELDVKDYSGQYDYDAGKAIPEDLFESGMELVRDSDFGDPSDSGDEFTGTAQSDPGPSDPGPSDPGPSDPGPSDPDQNQ